MNISNIKNNISNHHDQFKSELIGWIVAQNFTHGLSLSHHFGVKPDRRNGEKPYHQVPYKPATERDNPNIIGERDRASAKSDIVRAGISIERAKADMKRLHRDLDRQLLGCRYHTRSDRTYGLFILEGQENAASLHVHALFRIAPHHTEQFERIFADDVPQAENLWKHIAPSGSHKLLVNDNAFAAATYVTKYLHMNSAADRILFSQNFISAKSQVSIL